MTVWACSMDLHILAMIDRYGLRDRISMTVGLLKRTIWLIDITMAFYLHHHGNVYLATRNSYLTFIVYEYD